VVLGGSLSRHPPRAVWSGAGGFGVSARLRDVGRFGQLVLEDGEASGGRRVPPPGWRDLAGKPDSAPTAFARLLAGYGYQWWAQPPRPTGIHRGAFLAGGAFGQYISTEQMVIAIQGAWRQHQDSDAEAEAVRAAWSCGARAPSGSGRLNSARRPHPHW
jgi:CubicO group peptidase (beta-lactamase class C family)